MTQADLLDWLKVHGCTVAPLPGSHSGRAIVITGSVINGRPYYLDLPLNRPAKCFTVCQACQQLGVPVPDCCKEGEAIAKYIKQKHYPNY